MDIGRIARQILADIPEVLQYYGDCRTILDEGGAWENMDASDMSVLVEKGREVTREELLALCEIGSVPELVDSANRSYWHSAEHKIAWIHDEDEDVHYFFGPD